jgi:hypothetical protein
MLKCNHIAAYPEEYLKLFSIPKDGQNNTLKIFIRALQEMVDPKRGLPFRNDDDRQKFKGDVLEVLSEVFFTKFNSDPRMGLTDYTPIAVSEDYGVDATGSNANGDLSMVQVKFRSNPNEVVTYAEIARTFTAGVLRHNLDPSKDHTIFVFTTANDVSRQCRAVLHDKLVVVSAPFIKRTIDNNKNFWMQSLSDIQEYLDYHRATQGLGANI